MESMRDLLKYYDKDNKMQEQFEAILREEVFTDPDVKSFLNEHQDLSEEVIRRSSAILYEFVNEKKKFQHNERGLVSGHYPVLVRHNNQIEIEYVPTKEEKQRQKQVSEKKRLNLFYMQSDVQGASFDTLELTQQREEAIVKATDFITQYDPKSTEYQKALYLHGAFGVGKTFLLGAVAKALTKKGHTVALVYYPSFCTDMKESIRDNSVNQKVDYFKSVEVLMLDDIGAESLSTWIRDDILGIILQHRMQYNLPTFFTSNLSMQQLQDEHLSTANNGAHEPMKARRIMERIKYLAEEIELKGKNKRHS